MTGLDLNGARNICARFIGKHCIYFCKNELTVDTPHGRVVLGPWTLESNLQEIARKTPFLLGLFIDNPARTVSSPLFDCGSAPLI
jgi:hypothetical protein